LSQTTFDASALSSGWLSEWPKLRDVSAPPCVMNV